MGCSPPVAMAMDGVDGAVIDCTYIRRTEQKMELPTMSHQHIASIHSVDRLTIVLV